MREVRHVGRELLDCTGGTIQRPGQLHLDIPSNSAMLVAVLRMCCGLEQMSDRSHTGSGRTYRDFDTVSTSMTECTSLPGSQEVTYVVVVARDIDFDHVRDRLRIHDLDHSVR